MGIVIKESTSDLRASIPFSAISSFLSNFNGLVTTATVNAPIDFATWATTGDAPVPVPFPIPAAINTISEPSKSASKRS